jgi:hypothetical protein
MLVIISKNINAISNTLKNYVFIYKPSLFHSHPFAVNLLKFRRQRTPLLWRHLETQRASTCIPLVSWVYSYVCPHRGCCNKMRAADKRRAAHEILHQSYFYIFYILWCAKFVLDQGLSPMPTSCEVQRRPSSDWHCTVKKWNKARHMLQDNYFLPELRFHMIPKRQLGLGQHLEIYWPVL